jgi:hypothetical protein
MAILSTDVPHPDYVPDPERTYDKRAWLPVSWDYLLEMFFHPALKLASYTVNIDARALSIVHIDPDPNAQVIYLMVDNVWEGDITGNLHIRDNLPVLMPEFRTSVLTEDGFGRHIPEEPPVVECKRLGCTDAVTEGGLCERHNSPIQ